MQCVDCHNRPTHTFDLPDRAMDKGLSLGDIAVTLPYIKKKGVEVLKAHYNSNEEASEKLPDPLSVFISRTTRISMPGDLRTSTRQPRQFWQSTIGMYSPT